MRIAKKNIIISTVLIIAIAAGIYFYEFQYFNKFSFVSPIDFEGDIPVRKKDIYGSGEFGAKRKDGRTHNGLDILANIGTPVKAMRSGLVINAEEKIGLGKYVEIQHSKDLVSIYAHLSEILVYKGKRVRQGQIIGKVGKTGNANYKKMKAHLHFEIRRNGAPQNPLEYFLKKEEGNKG